MKARMAESVNPVYCKHGVKVAQDEWGKDSSWACGHPSRSGGVLPGAKVDMALGFLYGLRHLAFIKGHLIVFLVHHQHRGENRQHYT